MKRTKEWDALWRGFGDTPDEAVEEVLAVCAEVTRMRPVFRAALGVCNGKSTMAQLIKACIRAARKAKGK